MKDHKPVTYVIAEAGVNHNGSADLAYKLIDAAFYAGADAVKFQTFKTEKLLTKDAKKANYQIQSTGEIESAYQMLKKLELKQSTFVNLAKYAKKLKIDFLSTAFDEDSLSFLVNTLGLKVLKIPSGELTNAPLVLAHARTKRDIILSTGMATLDEIRSALGVIAYGYFESDININPSIKKFQEAYASKSTKSLIKEKVTILHCTTEYPAPLEEINLSALESLSNEFGVKIGYSDHTKGIIVPPVAVALGAKVIEKHFTLDRDMPGPDHQASIQPNELKKMIENIRDIEKSMGSGVKEPSISEFANKEIARKSIVAESKIKKGEIFNKNNISIKRPGGGISPYKYWEFLGRISKNDYDDGDIIDE